MTLLLAGLIVFLGCHSISIFANSWRDATAQRLGPNLWRILYSLVSLAGFLMIIYGYGQARMTPTVLYMPPDWTRHISYTLMLPVFPLLLAAYLPGRIRSTLKHPMLTAVKLWALSHLLVNGTLADVLLFGSFLVWAGVDRASLKRRTPREIQTLPATPANDVIAVVAGLALFALFLFYAHGWLFGVYLVT